MAASDTYKTTTNTSMVIAPLVNDTDPDSDPLQFISWITAPTFGILSSLGNGSFRYTPSGAAGVDVLRYNVSDGKMMATGMVTISIGKWGTVWIVALLFTGAEVMSLCFLKAGSAYG